MATTHDQQRRVLPSDAGQSGEAAGPQTPQVTAPTAAAPAPGRALPAATSADPLGGTSPDKPVLDTLARRRGAGRALPTSVADELSTAYGADLSKVRVHADGEADTVSRSVQASAFTHGSDVYFSAGTYSPESSSGKRLLAHELAHVAQQQSGRDRGGSGVTIGRADDPLEREADRMADGALAGLRRQSSRRPDSSEAPSTLHRTVRRYGKKDKVDDGSTVLGSLNEMLGAIEMVNTTTKNWSDHSSTNSAGEIMNKGQLFTDGKHGSFDGGNSGGFGMSGVGLGLDVVGLGSTGIDLAKKASKVNSTTRGDIDHNAAGKELEDTVWKGAGGMLSASNNAANIAKTAGSHLPGDLVPGLDFASSITSAAKDAKGMVEDSVAAERLRGQKSTIKHEMDHQLPEAVRLARFTTFLDQFELSPSLKSAATDLEAKTKAAATAQGKVDTAKGALDDAKALAGGLAGAQKKQGRAQARVGTAKDKVSTLTDDLQTAKGQSEQSRQRNMLAKAPLRHAKGRLVPDAPENAMAQLEYLQEQETYEQGGTAGQLSQDKRSERRAGRALDRANDKLKDRESEFGTASAKVDESSTAKTNLPQLEAAVTAAEKELQAAEKALATSKGSYDTALQKAHKDAGRSTKTDDLPRFAGVLTAFAAAKGRTLLPTGAAPAGLDDGLKKQFIAYLAEKGEKDFGFGTEARKAYQKQMVGERKQTGVASWFGSGRHEGGTRTKQADGTMDFGGADAAEKEQRKNFGDLRGLKKVAEFGHRRKAEMATLKGISAAGNTLDAAGTFTGAADGGATKATGKVIKGLKAGYEGIKGLVKRGRRVSKLAEARNEMEYGGGGAKRGFGWKAKMFFGGGNIEEHLEKSRDSLEEAQGQALGAGGQLTHDATKGFKGAGKQLSTEKAYEAVRKLTLQADRRASDLITGLRSQNDVVRDRAKQVVHILAETNLAGALAKIKDTQLDQIRDLYKADPKSAPLKKLEDEIRGMFKKQLEGVGG